MARTGEKLIKLWKRMIRQRCMNSKSIDLNVKHPHFINLSTIRVKGSGSIHFKIPDAPQRNYYLIIVEKLYTVYQVVK